MTARLIAEGVSHAYGDRPTIQGVSLEIHPGERLALLGANGAGKTTLIYLLAGLLARTTGRLTLDGLEVGQGPHDLLRLRKAVGLLFQHPDDQLFGPTVLDDVAIGPRNAGHTADDAATLAREALGQLGVSTLAEEPIHALSLGQRRTVALAGVLVMAPQILLLDEPTQGLDADAEDALLLTLATATARGASVVMATHDVELVYRWADRVALLQGGRLVGFGTPADVLAAPSLLGGALRRAWFVDVARELRRLGVLSAESPTPRSGVELTAQLLCQPTLRPAMHAGDQP